MTEKMLTYALGRGLGYYDMPAVRKIVRMQAARELPFLVAGAGYGREPAVSDESKEGRYERSAAAVPVVIGGLDHDVYYTKSISPAAPFCGAWAYRFCCRLLDSMVPAQTPWRRPRPKPQLRLGLCFMPHGAVMANWTPVGARAPTSSSRARWRRWSRIRTRSSWSAIWRTRWPRPAGPGDNGGDHTRSPAVFLNGVHPKRTDGADIQAGMTIDQIAAAKIGQETPLPSLELATEDFSGLVGSCDVGFSCTYMNTISWRTPTTPLAHGDQSARRVRSPVRRRRNAGGAPGAHRAAAQHSRRGDRADARLQGELGRERPQPGGRIPRYRARNRAAHSAGGKTERQLQPDGAGNRPAAFPTITKRTPS